MMSPIYLRVADELEAAIAKQPTGTELPSENELARRYRVSRLTARASLEELERRYLVRRAQGRRTLVARRIDYIIGPDRSPSWSDGVRLAGATPHSRTVRLQLRKPPPAVRTALGIDPRRNALFLSRLRFVDDQLAACAETWLAPDLVPMFAERMPADGSLHAVLAQTYRLAPHRGWARVELALARRDVAKRLELEGRPFVVKLDGTTVSRKTGRTIECTTSWLRADVFNIVFEMGALR